MARFTTALAVGLLVGGSMLVATAPASALTRYCPTRESFFGTVQSAQGNTIILRTDDGRSGTVTIDNGARVDTHGYAMRPGTYVGAYGCLTPNGVFHASEVTLAANQSLYAQTITGVVRRKAGDRLFVYEPSRGTTGIWYVPDVDDFRVGETVTGTGMLAASGEFYPQSINNASTAYVPEMGPRPAPRSITLSGIVRRIVPGALIVWEPSRRTTGTWFVRNAGAFRVGESVIATGTENRRGDFYPFSVRRS